MRKAVLKNQAARPYANLALEIANGLVEKINRSKHPLLFSGRGKDEMVVLVTSDKGLCGGINTRAIKEALEISSLRQFLTIGKKGKDFLAAYNYKIFASFEGFGEQLDFSRVSPIAKLMIDEFLAGKFGKVSVVHTEFISTISQQVKVSQLLPFESKTESVEGKKIDPHAVRDKVGTLRGEYEYTFEPGEDEVLDSLLPRILETQLWHAILENTASEHASRMVAMKNATDNARDLIDDLTLDYNQLRQSQITGEIAEIATAKVAME